MIFCRNLHRCIDRFDAALVLLIGKVNQMSQELDALTAAVARSVEVQAQAVTVIQGIAARIAAATTDPAALKALTDNLTASADALQAAVTADATPSPVV